MHEMDDLMELTVSELKTKEKDTDFEVGLISHRLQELMEEQRQIKQAIYEKTPRDLSIVEVERMLGFKVNIVEKDKMRILY